jgi:hypothetical protein
MENGNESTPQDANQAAADTNEAAEAKEKGTTPADEKGEPIDPWRMAEFCSWFVVVLAPILTWVNGPPVSTDQAVVRWIVFLLALTGGIVFSTMNFLRWRRQKRA